MDYATASDEVVYMPDGTAEWDILNEGKFFNEMNDVFQIHRMLFCQQIVTNLNLEVE